MLFVLACAWVGAALRFMLGWGFSTLDVAGYVFATLILLWGWMVLDYLDRGMDRFDA